MSAVRKPTAVNHAAAAIGPSPPGISCKLRQRINFTVKERAMYHANVIAVE